MSSIETNSSVYDSLGLSQSSSQTAQSSNSNELGQDAFMELMIAQLKNQNPLEPMENGEFLAQMAQFSTASGVGELKDSFDNFTSSFNSNQALQASSLVGREVQVPSNTALLTADGSVNGTVDLPVSSPSLRISIVDQSGQTVRTIDMGQQSSGEVAFSWDGTDDSGTRVDEGNYYIAAEALLEGQTYALDTSVIAPVESVTLGQGGSNVSLSVAGQGNIPMSSVRKIM